MLMMSGWLHQGLGHMVVGCLFYPIGKHPVFHKHAQRAITHVYGTNMHINIHWSHMIFTAVILTRLGYTHYKILAAFVAFIPYYTVCSSSATS